MGALDKRVPKWVFCGSPEKIGAFLGAYFACDGNVTNKGLDRNGQQRPDATVEFYSVSKGLLEDTQRLLLRMGVQSRLAVKNGRYRGERHTSWRLGFCNLDAVAQFATKVNIHGVKRERMERLRAMRKTFQPQLLADPVISVERVGLLPCRCLTVETDHTFTVDDIVVHNSLLLSQRFPAWMLGVNPDLRVRLACYNQTHAKRFSDTNIQLMKDPDFLNVFPDAGARLPNQVAKEEWSTMRRIEIRDANPSFKALGLGSGFTGMGADCLAGETLIDTAEGWMRIDALCAMPAPPLVRSWSHKRRAFAWCRVLATRALPCPALCEVVTRGGRRIRCTPDHSFYARGRGYVAANELRAGDGLVLSDGLWAWDEIALVALSGDGATVYDLQVEECENFFAGGVLVHNCAIIDDPYKNRAEAFSDVINENIWLWYTTVLLSRCNPATNIIVMFHRWRELDLAGRLLEQGGWEMWRFAAIGDGADDDPMKREKGVILTPRYPLSYLENVRQVQGELDFLSLYQGSPTNAAGTIFKKHHLLPVGEDGACPDGDDLAFWPFPSWVKVRDAVLSADTAVSKRQQADMSAIGLFFRSEDGYDYIYPLMLRRADVDGVVREICVSWAKWRVELGPVLRGFALEAGAAGLPAAQQAHAMVKRAKEQPSEEDYKLDTIAKRKDARNRTPREREAMERVSATYKPNPQWSDIEWEAVRAAPPLQLATYKPGTLEKGGKGDIIARANQITPRVGNRRVRICADERNYAVARAWLGQLLALPSGAHDDAVQATIEGVLALGEDEAEEINSERPHEDAMETVFG